MTTITIVTPWHNHPEFAEDYWRAVRYSGCDALVIDNGSDPPLPNAHRLDTNTGFSYASNVGLGLARTEAVLFLNNDIKPVDPNWCDGLRGALEPGVLVGAKIRHDVHGNVDGMALPYLDGWCLAGMRDDLLELGGWDESYDEPSYYGDNDLCFRARLAGMTLREVPVGLVHKGGGTSQANGYLLPSTVANKKRFERSVREALVAV